jgi:hypothetical protein
MPSRLFDFLGGRAGPSAAVPSTHPAMARFAPLLEGALRFEAGALEEVRRRGGLAAVTPCHLRGHAGWERGALETWFRDYEAAIPGGLAAFVSNHDRDWQPLPPTDAGRRLYALGNDILKVASHAHGRESNLAEARLWTRASAALSAWLAPVLAAAPDGSWLVMRHAYPAGVSAPTAATMPAELAREVGDTAFPSHWGFIGEQPVLVDYAARPCRG